MPTLYMTIRNDDCPNGVLCPDLESARQFSVSVDLGMSWTPRQNVQVPDCGNKGSVLATSDGNALVLSTSASCVNRKWEKPAKPSHACNHGFLRPQNHLLKFGHDCFCGRREPDSVRL